MSLRVLLIGFAAVALLVGVLELASIATERVARRPALTPNVSTEGFEPDVPTAPEIEDTPPAPTPAITH